MWTERTELLLGKDGVERLRRALVVVVGTGGVGAAAAEMLARAGVGRIVLIDNDTVSETNLNRQVIALRSTVGKVKCEVLKERLLDINPEIEVLTVQEYLNEENIPAVFARITEAPVLESSVRGSGSSLAGSGSLTEGSGAGTSVGGSEESDGSEADGISFVVDTIDTLSPKIALIQFCLRSGIPFVSSMGSGAKMDATKVRIADISKTKICPLAHMLRKRLHKLGIREGFPAVYSEEEPRRESVTLEESRNKKSQVGTISYLPAVFGCVCAQAAIQHITEKK